MAIHRHSLPHRLRNQFIVVNDLSTRFRATLETGVVFAIVMAVSAIGIQYLHSGIVKHQIAESFVLTSTVRGELTAFRAQNGFWPADATTLGNPTLSQASDLGMYVDHMEYDGVGGVTVNFSDERSAEELKGRYLTFKPYTNPDNYSAPVVWLCGSAPSVGSLAAQNPDRTDISREHLPSICRY